MEENQYNAQQALDLLMKKLAASNEGLAAQVRAAIDIGKDVSEVEPSLDRRRKGRAYRKAVPLTQEEALRIALDVLQAYFVEQPLFVDSTADNFAETAIGIPKQGHPDRVLSPGSPASEREPLFFEGINEEKVVEIEMQTEMQLTKTGEETVLLKREPRKLIDEQVHNIETLRKLLSF
jgi:hypothetical protein